jgi:hypothetical protein
MAFAHFVQLFFVLCNCLSLSSTQDIPSISPVTPELVYTFPTGTTPENISLRSNGQLLVTCLTCSHIFQLDPTSGPSQPKRVVHTFPNALSVTGMVELTTHIFAVGVGSFDVASKLVTGPTSVWTIDLTDYQAPSYNSSRVQANNVASESLAIIFDGSALINASRGLITASDFIAGKIWLVDILNNRTSVLASGVALQGPGGVPGSLASSLSVNGLKFQNERVYFTITVEGLFGYVAVNPSTGIARGPLTTAFDCGISLDDFHFAQSGNVYLTTFDTLGGGILRRAT